MLVSTLLLVLCLTTPIGLAVVALLQPQSKYEKIRLANTIPARRDQPR